MPALVPTAAAGRAWIAAAALAFFAPAATLDFYQRVSAANRAAGDPYQMEAQRQRYSGLMAALPAGSVAGYLSDESRDSARGAAMFYGARYWLAPSLLVAEPSPLAPALVVGNFARPADYESLGRRAGLRLKRDFGAGVVLYGREKP